MSFSGMAFLLSLAVIFVNGWTDAPNAIATAVASGALSFRRAAGLAALCNLAGAVLSTLFFPAVARTVWSLAGSGGTAPVDLCAVFSAIVLWAAAAWRLGIPTSESHALLGGLAGAALAIPGGWTALHGWRRWPVWFSPWFWGSVWAGCLSRFCAASPPRLSGWDRSQARPGWPFSTAHRTGRSLPDCCSLHCRPTAFSHRLEPPFSVPP